MDEQAKMEEVLEKLGLGSEEVKARFRGEKIHVSTVPLLTRDQLKELGIETLGEQTLLKEACKNSFGYSRVANEVKRLMQPLPTSQPCSSAGNSITIQRYSAARRKNKGGRSKNKPQIQPKTPKFQKKLVVFKFMGENPPYTFSRREEDILLRGLLPEISVEANENDVRGEIVKVLHNNKEFQLCDFTEQDFEFMDVNGKKVSVPTCGEGHQFNGKAVKQIAGVGAVYIRLQKKIPRRFCYISDDSDFEPSFKIRNPCHTDSDSSFELPPPFNLEELPDKDHPLATLTSGPCSSVSILEDFSADKDYPSVPCSSVSTPFPGELSVDEADHPLAISSVPCSSISTALYSSTASTGGILSNVAPSTERVIILCLDTDDDIADPSSTTQTPITLESIQEQFSDMNLSMENVTTIFEIAGRSYGKTVGFLQNCTIDNLLNLVYESVINFCTEESPGLRITQDSSDEEMVEVVLGFYKSKRFSKSACVRVSNGGRVVDSGGVRRQLYSTAFDVIAGGHLDIFDGPPGRVRPCIKPSNIVSGLLKTLGTAIAHSLLMDKTGFPFLSPPIYYYLVGKYDVAITLLDDVDISGQALHVIRKMKLCSNSDRLVDDEEDLKYIENVLDESGSDLELDVTHKDEIIQTILIHFALHKKKVFLDSLAEGLEVYKIYSLMRIFPELFRLLFTSKELTCHDIIERIVPTAVTPEDDDHVMKIIATLFEYLSELSSNECRNFLGLVTGSRYLSPADRLLLDFTSRDSDPAQFTHVQSVLYFQHTSRVLKT